MKTCPECARNYDSGFVSCDCGSGLPEITTRDLAMSWMQGEHWLYEAAQDSPETAWQAVLEILRQDLTAEEVAALAAGPVDLLCRGNEGAWIARVKGDGEKNPRVQRLLSAHERYAATQSRCSARATPAVIRNCSLLGALLMAAALCLAGCSTSSTREGGAQEGVVHRYGHLEVRHGQLCDQFGRPVQLRGMSTHDLKQFPFTRGTVANLAKDWDVSVIRAAMYTDSYGSSYIRQPEVKQTVKLIVEEAIRNDVYVIVDWHILQDGDPNRYREQARAFFQEMAQAYGSHPNVIYEICNEPNGTNVTWKDIKAYAEYVIPSIRAIDPQNIIIVGTDTWCQGVAAASESPLEFSNVMYGLHFYAGTHRDALRGQADLALSRGLPIFVSEWGLTDASGKGALYFEEGQRWVDWMNARGISWAGWSFSNCDEGSAALTPSAGMSGPWRDEDLSPSGKWIKRRILGQRD